MTPGGPLDWKEKDFKREDLNPVCSDLQVVVLMGGLGTRLKEFTKNTPKALVDVNGKPFFDYELMLLKHYGFRKFLFLIGYKADMIEEYYGSGEDFGVSIEYCYDGEELLGTGGAIRRAYDLLEEDFMVIYGDSFMDIDYEETVFRYFKGKEEGKRAVMTLLRNGDRFDKSNVILKDGRIILYDKEFGNSKNTGENEKKSIVIDGVSYTSEDMEYIDYGVCIYEKSLFKDFEYGKKFDLAILQNRLSLDKELAAHIVNKRFYEIGSPGALSEFKQYIHDRLEVSRPAVFLDRDGVLDEIVFNEDIEQLDAPLSIEEFKLFPFAVSAVKLLKEKGYYVFIASNQPAAAKGKVGLLTIYDINTHMLEIFSKAGADLDGSNMCIHYPKKLPYLTESFKDEVLIRKCNCRKPLPGLILRPKDIYNIDYDNSYMVGDSITDIQAGEAAGVKTVFIGDLKCDACRKLCETAPDLIVKDLLEFSESLKAYDKS